MLPSGTPSFSRAPLHMRYSRESYFEPNFVSIGPYYYSLLNLKEKRVMAKAEECFLYFLSKLPTTSTSSETSRETSCESSSEMLSSFLEEIYAEGMTMDRISRSYSKSSCDIPDAEFNKMLVRDSCFIIQIILAISRDGQDSMFYPGIDIKTVRYDLLLLENQIPFYFLKRVYQVLRKNNLLPQSAQSPRTATTADQFLNELKPFIWLDMPWQFNEEHANFTEPKHLLDLYWQWCIPNLKDQAGRTSDPQHQQQQLLPSNSQGSNPPNQSNPMEKQGLLASSASRSTDPQNHDNDESWKKIHLRSNAPKKIKNADELYRSVGVTFKKRAHEDGFGLTFQKGILQLPHLQLDPSQTKLLANLIAFEESKPSKERVMTSYVLLLAGLINTEKDVELLQRYGVITNKLGTSSTASTYINDIGNICFVDYENHYCGELFDDLNRYCKSYWTRQFANLRHTYFNSPWAVISLLAGATLLILSALQTYYNIARYYRHP